MTADLSRRALLRAAAAALAGAAVGGRRPGDLVRWGGDGPVRRPDALTNLIVGLMDGASDDAAFWRDRARRLIADHLHARLRARDAVAHARNAADAHRRPGAGGHRPGGVLSRWRSLEGNALALAAEACAGAPVRLDGVPRPPALPGPVRRKAKRLARWHRQTQATVEARVCAAAARIARGDTPDGEATPPTERPDLA